MNPSTAGSGARPARYAASAAAITSRGCSSFRFSAAAMCAWYSQGSPPHIASCQRPKCSRRSSMKLLQHLQRLRACHRPAEAVDAAGVAGEARVCTRSITSCVMASGSKRGVAGTKPGPSAPKAARLSASKFQSPPSGCVAVHQHVVAAPHLAVEILHAQLLAALAHARRSRPAC